MTSRRRIPCQQYNATRGPFIETIARFISVIPRRGGRVKLRRLCGTDAPRDVIGTASANCSHQHRPSETVSNRPSETVSKLAKESAMSRTTIMTTAMVLGVSFAASANAAEYFPAAGYYPATSSWSTSSWPATSGWSTSNQRELNHQRYLTPAEHQALHRGLGYGSQYPTVLPSRTNVYPYGSFNSARPYDSRHLPAWRTPARSTWPSPVQGYPYGGSSSYLNGGYCR
jgi:hypothetical protein